jgi:hypothetical protein
MKIRIPGTAISSNSGVSLKIAMTCGANIASSTLAAPNTTATMIDPCLTARPQPCPETSPEAEADDGQKGMSDPDNRYERQVRNARRNTESRQCQGAEPGDDPVEDYEDDRLREIHEHRRQAYAVDLSDDREVRLQVVEPQAVYGAAPHEVIAGECTRQPTRYRGRQAGSADSHLRERPPSEDQERVQHGVDDSARNGEDHGLHRISGRLEDVAGDHAKHDERYSPSEEGQVANREVGDLRGGPEQRCYLPAEHKSGNEEDGSKEEAEREGLARHPVGRLDIPLAEPP